MRALTLTLVCCSLLWAGCMTAQVDSKLAQAVTGYRAIKKGMTADEVTARLGTPQNTVQNGILHWEYKQDALHYAGLYVILDSRGRVEEPMTYSYPAEPSSTRAYVARSDSSAPEYPTIPDWRTKTDGALAYPYNANNANPLAPPPPNSR